ncbi:MAG: carboxymuconolactone decarboxylase family protein [Paracoccaceae bacterium]
MPLVEPLSEEQMDPGLRAEVQFFKGPLGVIPNSVRTMAHRPAIARAFTELNIAVMTDYGAVTPEFKRLLGYVSSFASGCLYCQAHMILASERFGASEARLNDVFDFEGSPHFTEAEKAALAFAQAATQVPNSVTQEIGARLRAHWPEEAIVEIMGVVALFGYLNRWNDSMGSALEDLPRTKGEERLAEATGWQVGKHVPD